MFLLYLKLINVKNKNIELIKIESCYESDNNLIYGISYFFLHTTKENKIGQNTNLQGVCEYVYNKIFIFLLLY